MDHTEQKFSTGAAGDQAPARAALNERALRPSILNGGWRRKRKMKRQLVIGASLALALLAGGAFLVGGENLAGATHYSKKIPVGRDRAAVLKSAFASTHRLETWVAGHCDDRYDGRYDARRDDCDRALADVATLRADLEALRLAETTGWTARPTVMNGPAFAAVVRAVHDAGYDARRIEMLRAHAGTVWFTAVQVRSLLGVLDCDPSRLTALELLAPRIVDPESGGVVLAAFDDAASRVRARALIARAMPSDPIPGRAIPGYTPGDDVYAIPGYPASW
jgi:hypothetical protein